MLKPMRRNIDPSRKPTKSKRTGEDRFFTLCHWTKLELLDELNKICPNHTYGLDHSTKVLARAVMDNGGYTE